MQMIAQSLQHTGTCRQHITHTTILTQHPGMDQVILPYTKLKKKRIVHVSSTSTHLKIWGHTHSHQTR